MSTGPGILERPPAAAGREPRTLDDAELLRLRDRVSTLEVQGRERWRLLARYHGRLRELEQRVQEMTEADKIAAAVNTAIRDERRAFMTFPRKVAGAGLAVLIAVPAAHELVVWIAAASG